MIIYFSGNGNSRHVAERLAELLGDNPPAAIDAKLISQREIRTGSDTERIIWVAPVHAWGLPKVVAAFMRSAKIENADKATHHLVVTCGDDTGYVDREWRKILKARQWRSGGCWNVFMPNTYVSLPGFDVDSREVESQKLTKSEQRIRDIATAITSSSVATDLFRGAMPWIKSYVLRPLFMAALTNPRFFRSDSIRCISCGLCVKCCPLQNISLDSSGHPRWGKDCTMCLGCYNSCPTHAIDYGSQTRGKGQYTYGYKVMGL